jgi:hypothetical protein
MMVDTESNAYIAEAEKNNYPSLPVAATAVTSRPSAALDSASSYTVTVATGVILW